MRCFLGLGSNLGDRRRNLADACSLIREGAPLLKVSPIYTTPALLPPGAPDDWNIPYLNAALEIEWNQSARELLQFLKATEQVLGRSPSDRWAPRVIDIDIVTFGDERIDTADLRIPHPAARERAFVLDPLKDIAPSLMLSADDVPCVVLARRLCGHSPLVMAILNMTPDSFSDGGDLESVAAAERRVQQCIDAGVQILDVGGESTRPGADILSVDVEWRRIEPLLHLLQKRFEGQILRPIVSVDTVKPEVARRALAAGADWINDVSGLSSPAMRALVAESGCHAVMMHHVSVPADPSKTLRADEDPVLSVKTWALERIEICAESGIAAEQLIFDPGIGFGKTPQQSLQILKRARELADLPVRTLIGHSRKSFMTVWGLPTVAGRDEATLGASMSLAEHGVDILRVHNAEGHMRALQARNELR
ncbi:MAG: dihydropteroate synthase [Deltaproteobacteria bacterium]|nr:dihydropteroate synthase [Deltaproteobacteria bacterium]